MERKGAATFQGNSLTLLGDELKIGQEAPDFKVLAQDLSEADLSTFKGKIKLIACVPSLDTPVCDAEIKRFNEEATKISKDIEVIFISMDLPFAQSRFCQSFKIDRVKTFSDHKEGSFGLSYGVLIKELRLLSRAIFIIDREEKLRYCEYVKEITQHPKYEETLTLLSEVV